LLAIELDLGARPLPEQHAVTAFNVERVELAGLVTHTGADGDHLALHRLFLDCVGNEDAPSGFYLWLDTTDRTRSCNGRSFIYGLLGPEFCEAWHYRHASASAYCLRWS